MIQIRIPVFAMTSLLLLSGMLGACTPSVSASYDRSDPFVKPLILGPHTQHSEVTDPGLLGPPSPERGSGKVVIALAPDVELSQDILSSFHAATGFTAHTLTLTSDEEAADVDADLVVGLDLLGLATLHDTVTHTPPFDLSYPEGGARAIEGALPYGRDDVCVLVDSGWMSAGQRHIPEGFEALNDAHVAFLLGLPDPSTTKSGAFFLLGAASRISTDLSQWVQGLKESGTFIGPSDAIQPAWTADDLSAESSFAARQERYHLLVAPMSTLTDTASTPGIEAQAHPLPGTCVERYLFAAERANAKNTSAARSFLAWLESSQGQRLLAESGQAYPLDTTTVENTSAQWFLTPMSDAVSLTAEEASQLEEHLATWKSALTH